MLVNESNIDIPMLAWLASKVVRDQQERDFDSNTFSATTLLKPIREIVLSRRVDWDMTPVDINGQIKASAGTAIHDGIENVWSDPKLLKASLEAADVPQGFIDRLMYVPNIKTDVAGYVAQGQIPYYTEVRRYKELNGKIITGQFDLVIDGQLWDYKTTSVWSWIFGSNDADYTKQLSIYKWLNPDLVTQDIGKIQMLFSDWMASKAIQDKSYPSQQILTKTLPLIPSNTIEEFMRRRINALIMYMDEPQNRLPECNRVELWQRDSSWAYYKNPDAQRATKVAASEAEAATYKATKGGGKGVIRHRPGEVVKCRYCSALSICDQAKELRIQGLLKDE